jgi:flavin-dependent dehydrogenase
MTNQNLQLEDGSKIGIVGGGPAGSFCAIFLLDMAERLGLDLKVEIYEPRDFTKPGPSACNMCGGIISESLVQHLAAEGIILPPTVVQRGIDSYMMHVDIGRVRIKTPLEEKRIGAVYRGPGPRDIKEIKWGSFDGHLQNLAIEKGADVVPKRVSKLAWVDGKPQINVRGSDPEIYDLLVIATGVNSSTVRLIEGLDLEYKLPKSTKTYIREYYLGEDTIAEYMGTSMHMFLLDIPRLKFAAIIPKGDYVTVCMLGEDIDNELVESFMGSAGVRQCFPSDWEVDLVSCHCSPRMSTRGAVYPYADRIVFIGDIGVTRLYKDGIGAAYRTAKAAATTTIFQGVSREDFANYYWPTCKGLENDNRIGKLIFLVANLIPKFSFAQRAVLRMTAREQQNKGTHQRMSNVLWDMFTGSAPYSDIFLNTLHPAFLARFIGDMTVSILMPKKATSDN